MFVFFWLASGGVVGDRVVSPCVCISVVFFGLSLYICLCSGVSVVIVPFRLCFCLCVGVFIVHGFLSCGCSWMTSLE